MFNKSPKELKEIYDKLKKCDEISDDKIQDYIHILAEEQYERAKPLIETFLYHKNMLVRKMALSALTLHWVDKKYEKYCIDLIMKPIPQDTFEADDLEFEQITAFSGLENILKNDKDKNILKALINIITNNKRSSLQKEMAYSGILTFFYKPKTNKISEYLEYKAKNKHINWKWIEELKKEY